MSFDNDHHQWLRGERRLAAAAATDPRRARILHRVVDGIVDELRRRLGGAFSSDELAELYERGTDWGLELASELAPDDPWAWEADTVVDAAFHRYLSRAVDYAGGRRLSIADERSC